MLQRNTLSQGAAREGEVTCRTSWFCWARASPVPAPDATELDRFVDDLMEPISLVESTQQTPMRNPQYIHPHALPSCTINIHCPVKKRCHTLATS